MSWSCPSCKNVIGEDKESCDRCVVRKATLLASERGLGRPVLNEAENIFLKCVKSAPEDTPSLSAEIDEFMGSIDMEVMGDNGWKIKEAVNRLLQSALAKEKTISAHSGIWMDPNSTALYMILVDRLNAKLEMNRFFDKSENLPVIIRPQLQDTWKCPNCQESHMNHVSECQRCDIRRNVITTSESGLAGPFFLIVEDIFIKCILMNKGVNRNKPVVDVTLIERREELSNRVEALLLSPDVDALIAANWLIKDAVGHLLRKVVSGARRIPFESETWMDVNSTALYMVLVDILEKRLEKEGLSDECRLLKPVIHALSDQWPCPSCKQMISLATNKCPTCDISQKSITLYRSALIAPMCKEIEKLFIECVNFRQKLEVSSDTTLSVEGLRTASTANDRLEALTDILRRAEELLASESMKQIVEKGWFLRSSVKFLLQGALLEPSRIVCDPTLWVDTDDFGITLQLVDSIAQHMETSGIQGAPQISIPPADALRWECPLCKTRIHPQVEACSVTCGNKKAVTVSCTQNMEFIFQEAKRIVLALMAAKNDGVDLSAVRQDMEKVTNSAQMWDFESRGFLIRSSFIVFFHRLLEITVDSPPIPFETGVADEISRCVFGVFVRWLSKELTWAGINCSLEEPHPHVFRGFSKQVHRMPSHAKDFLLSNDVAFRQLCKDIAAPDESPSGLESKGLLDLVLEKFQTSGWVLGDAVNMMRYAVRDLESLTESVDKSDKAIIEALLNYVISLEEFLEIARRNLVDGELQDITPTFPPGSADESFEDEEEMLRRAIEESLKLSQPTDEELLQRAIEENLGGPTSIHMTQPPPSPQAKSECAHISSICDGAVSSLARLTRVPSFTGPPELQIFSWNDITDIDCTKHLGKGSFGVVLKAKLRGREIAVKCLFETPALSYEQCVELARKESQITLDAQRSVVNQDLILHLQGLVLGELPDVTRTPLRYIMHNQEKAVGILMTLESGGTLFSMLHGEIEVPVNAVEMLLNVSKGLAELHEVGIVHGDIKSSNILLSRHQPPDIRLADFGNAEVRELALAETTLVQTFRHHGTPVYSAPEMLGEGRVAKASRKTDVYAFGILMWEVLTRKQPSKYCPQDITSFREYVRKGERPDINLLSEDTAPSLRDLMQRCWSSDRDQRPTMTEVVSVLSTTHSILASKHFDIFFSHAWATKDFLSHVYFYLTSFGFRVWYDENDMERDLDESMKRGIENSTIFLSCINKTYQSRSNCMMELAWAKRQNKEVVTVVTDANPFDWASDSVKLMCGLSKTLFLDLSHVASDPAWSDFNLDNTAAKQALYKELSKLVTMLKQAKCLPALATSPGR